MHGGNCTSVVYEMTFSVVVFKEAVEDSYKIDKTELKLPRRELCL